MGETDKTKAVVPTPSQKADNFSISMEEVEKVPASIGHKWSTGSDKEFDMFRLVCKHLGIANPPKTVKSNHAFRYAVERLAIALEEGNAEIVWNVDRPSELTQPQDFDISKITL